MLRFRQLRARSNNVEGKSNVTNDGFLNDTNRETKRVNTLGHLKKTSAARRFVHLYDYAAGPPWDGNRVNISLTSTNFKRERFYIRSTFRVDKRNCHGGGIGIRRGGLDFER